MDFYNEDGDSNIDYSNRDDFYAGNVQPELEFQTFDSSETEGVPAPDFGDVEMNDVSGDSNGDKSDKPKRAPGEGKIWQLSYYQQYCDVDTLDVAKRIGSTFAPIKSFFEIIDGNPDLYGWFWIATTLIFVVAAAGNFASYLTYSMNDRENDWAFDFAKLGFGAMTIYLYVTVIPVLVFVALKLWLELKPTLMDNFCIYGYSLFPYIPAATVMVIPIEYIRWAVMIIACLLVTIFLIRSYVPEIKSRPMEGGVILVIMVLLNILLALVLQFYFFEYFVEPSSSEENSSDNETSASSEYTTEEEDLSETPTPSISQIIESSSPSPSISEILSSSPTPSISPSISPSMDSTITLSPTESPAISSTFNEIPPID